jgi:predicted negative regulator of RcsB-dependent stress response
MASPSNASEPESPDEEDEVIDTGFDAILFWDRYRNIVIVAITVVILGLAGFGIYHYNQTQTIAAAGAALAQASSEDDYRAVIAKYPGTVAAGDASLFLASKLRSDKKYDDAMQVLQTFMDKYPAHPLVSAGDLSIAETLEAQGKNDDALTKYQEVAAKYPDSYAAPVAVLNQANLLQYEGKIEEARRVYENFVAQFPDSIFAQQAMAEMRLMRTPAGGAAAAETPAATQEQNPEGLPNFMQPLASPAPGLGGTGG